MQTKTLLSVKTLFVITVWVKVTLDPAEMLYADILHHPLVLLSADRFPYVDDWYRGPIYTS